MKVEYIFPFLASAMLSLLLTPIVRRITVRYKFVSFPKQDRWRKKIVASGGGIAIFISFLIAYLLFGDYSFDFMGFIIGAMGIFWLGLIDDLVHIKPDTKLIGQIIVACIAVMFGTRFNLGASPLVDVLLTIFWVVGIINAFNLLDNMDGLCAGIAAISSLILGIHSIINNASQLAVLSFVLFGASLGFLRYNFNPAKIFMGDCGSMFLGYSLGVGALMGNTRQTSSLLVTLAIPLLVLAVPIFDTLFVTLARIFNNRPISQGGRDHTSHRLVSLGLSERTAVLLLYGISAIFGLGAVLYDKLDFVHMTVFAIILFIGLVIFGIFLGSEVKVYSEKELNNLGNKKRLNGAVIFNGFIYHKRRIAEVLLDFILIALCYVCAYILRFEGILFGLNIPLILESLPIILIMKFLMFYFFGLYRGVWRYIGIYDIIAIFKATSLGSLVSIFILLFLFRFRHYSRTVFIIDWLLTLISISGVRVLFRLYNEFFANIRRGDKRVLIFGAGAAGELALRETRQNRLLNYKAIGFIDDDRNKLDRIIHGIKVIGTGEDLERMISRYKVDEVLIAIPLSPTKRNSQIKEICGRAGVPCKEISKIIPVEG